MGRNFLLALLVVSATAGAQTYRWKDERGVTYYGDQVPSQYKDSAQVELSKGGIPIKKIEAALTPAQRAELEAKKAADAEAAKKRDEFERVDRALMSKYANSAELAAAHRRDLERIDDELTAFTARANDVTKATNLTLEKKRLSKENRTELGFASGELLQIVDIIQRKLAEREETTKRHAQERERFEGLMKNKKTG
jgi:Domain of unknown function (DUF4124)